MSVNDDVNIVLKKNFYRLLNDLYLYRYMNNINFLNILIDIFKKLNMSNKKKNIKLLRMIIIIKTKTILKLIKMIIIIFLNLFK